MAEYTRYINDLHLDIPPDPMSAMSKIAAKSLIEICGVRGAGMHAARRLQVATMVKIGSKMAVTDLQRSAAAQAVEA